jgi:hypothetical protein
MNTVLEKMKDLLNVGKRLWHTMCHRLDHLIVKYGIEDEGTSPESFVRVIRFIVIVLIFYTMVSVLLMLM